MINNLFFNLIVAHILGDFYLQWGSSCKNKVLYSVKGKDLWLHSLVIGILSWCAIWDFRGWWLAACIMVLHFLIDWAKSYIQVKWDIFKIENPKQVKLVDGTNKRHDLRVFLIDQIYTLVSSYYLSIFGWQQIMVGSNLAGFKNLRLVTHCVQRQ